MAAIVLAGCMVAPRRAARLVGLAAVAALAARPFAFLAAPAAQRTLVADRPVAPQPGPALGAQPGRSSAGTCVGAWAVAAALAAVGARASRVARGAEGSSEAAEQKKPFDVFQPETYGNITMDDVKKYGGAGTFAYVVTELAFWAIAVPTECGIFYQTAGRWPDFSSDTDKAAVLGFVFAASNIARLCLPLRFGAALALAPWIDENVMSRLPGRTTEA